MGGKLQPELHAGPADVAEATTPPHGAAADPSVFSEPQPGHDHRWHTGNVLRARDAFNEPVPKSVSKLFVKSHSADKFMIYQNTEYLQIYTSMI